MKTKVVDLETGRGTSLSPLQLKALQSLHVEVEISRAGSADRSGGKRRSFFHWLRDVWAFGKNHIFVSWT